MGIYEHLAQMKPHIQRRDWTGLEETFRGVAEKLCGPDLAKRIFSLDFVSYQAAISAGLYQAKERASRLPIKAIYFEYNLDNEWDGTFFLCGSYRSETTEDDDWACNYLETVPGPSFSEASSIYNESGFDGTDPAKGSTLYLIARTVAAFGRVTCLDPWNLPICIAYHDQDPIVRIRE